MSFHPNFCMLVVARQVWDPDMLADTSRESLLHKHKLTPYQDMKLKGKVLATFVSGHQVGTRPAGLAPCRPIAISAASREPPTC